MSTCNSYACGGCEDCADFERITLRDFYSGIYEYVGLNRYQADHPEQRRGQAMFNYACSMSEFADKAEQARGTEADPFYDDSRCGAFLVHLGLL